MSEFKKPFTFTATSSVFDADGKYVPHEYALALLNRDQVSGEAQEPVAITDGGCVGWHPDFNGSLPSGTCLYTHPTARVTESMVERALENFSPGAIDTNDKAETNRRLREAMRAALTAALGGEGKS